MITLSKTNTRYKKLTLIEAISLAIGVMIGASIFTLLGLGLRLVGSFLTIVFILAGIYALLVGYSYGTLGSKIINNAGPVAYIHYAFRNHYLSGIVSILLWLGYVISLALFANSFSYYFMYLFNIPNIFYLKEILSITIICLFVVINLKGDKTVGFTEKLIVFTKLLILGLLIFVGLFKFDPTIFYQNFKVAPNLYTILYTSTLFFLSYMGFGIITNINEKLENPHENTRKAILYSIIIVMFVYVGIAFVASGNLPINELINTSQLEEVAAGYLANHILGLIGKIIVSIGALISICSAINASLYGGANISYALAKEGELPEFFEEKTIFGIPESLFITSLLGIIFLLLFPLKGIANIISVLYIIIYLLVVLAHYKLHKIVGGRKELLIGSIFILIIVLITILYYNFKHEPYTFIGIVITLISTLLFEYIYRKYKNRQFFKFTPLKIKI